MREKRTWYEWIAEKPDNWLTSVNRRNFFLKLFNYKPCNVSVQLCEGRFYLNDSYHINGDIVLNRGDQISLSDILEWIEV